MTARAATVVAIAAAVLAGAVSLAGQAPATTPGAATSSGGSASAPPRAVAPPHASILAYYYLDHERDGWRGDDTPLLGEYASDDSDVLRQHIRWAKQAGIDGFLVSWSRSRDLDQRLRALAEVAAAEDFRLGLLLEARRRTSASAERAAADLDHFLATFASLTAFRLHDEPLVVWNGTSTYSREEIARVSAGRRDRVALLASERSAKAYRRIADLVDGDAYYWSSADPRASTYAEHIGSLAGEVASHGGLWIAPATPGYQRASGERVVERRDGETLRLSVAGAAATGADFVGLISWNQFTDGTQVEPSRRHGTRALETLALLHGGILAGTSADASRSVPVLAYYYIWFDPRSWQRGKRDHPLLGSYSSDDAEVMRLHVRWAKQAGIDGFIVSWKVDDDLDRRLAQLVEIARAEEFKLAIIYQGLDFQRRPRAIEVVERDFESFAQRYAADPVFRMFKRPVVIWNGIWEYSRTDVERVTAPRRDRLAILAAEKSADDYERVAALVDGNAYYWSSADPASTPGFREKLSKFGRVVHEKGGLWIAPAAPGFDARLIGGEQVVDRRDGETLRQSAMAAMLSGPDAIGLISWNEFSENTHVEPSQELHARYLEVVAELRGGAAPRLDFRSLAVDPGTIEIRTVPPMRGARFVLDGRTLEADSSGIIRLPMSRPGVHRLEALPIESTGPERVRFVGWESLAPEPVREIVVPLRRAIEAGFEIERETRPVFVGENGQPLADPITLLVKDSQGRRVAFAEDAPRWLPRNAVLRRMSGLDSVELEYRVERAELGGVNVVNAGQQRFRLDSEEPWRIEVLVHTVRFDARDALFRFPLGTGVALTFPDGRTEELPFDRSGGNVVRTLPRGELEVRAVGAGGLALAVPVILSRAQEVTAPVVTWWSLIAIALAALLACAAVLLAARPRWRTALSNGFRARTRSYRRRSPDSVAD